MVSHPFMDSPDSHSKVVPLHPPLSPEDLLLRLQAGDGASATLLVEHFGQMVNRLVRSALGPDQDHEDLVHRVYCELIVHIHRVRQAPQLTAWVQQVTLNLVRTEIRSRTVRRKYSGEVTDLENHQTQRPEDHEARQLLGKVYDILDTFSEEHRLAFVLRMIERHSIPEIALMSQTSESTVKRRVQKAWRLFEASARHIPELAARLEPSTPSKS